MRFNPFSDSAQGAPEAATMVWDDRGQGRRAPESCRKPLKTLGAQPKAAAQSDLRAARYGAPSGKRCSRPRTRKKRAA